MNNIYIAKKVPEFAKSLNFIITELLYSSENKSKYLRQNLKEVVLVKSIDNMLKSLF
jgi:hypothetical protein